MITGGPRRLQLKIRKPGIRNAVNLLDQIHGIGSCRRIPDFDFIYNVSSAIQGIIEKIDIAK